MTTIEMIWGPDALLELMKPHRDPKIRQMEEEMAQLTAEFYRHALARKPERHDPLPAHYRKIGAGEE